MTKYSKKYPNFEFQRALYFYSDSCFGDSSHLNAHGARQFTAWLSGNYAPFFSQ